jgi:hypothetical protein
MKRPDEVTWVSLAVVVVVIVLVAILKTTSAHGHAGDDDLSAWYRSLQTPSGASCCNMTDCSPVEAEIRGDHWEAKIDGEWRMVPPEVILKRENMDGRPIACVFRGELRCFILPSSS